MIEKCFQQGKTNALSLSAKDSDNITSQRSVELDSDNFSSQDKTLSTIVEEEKQKDSGKAPKSKKGKIERRPSQREVPKKGENAEAAVDGATA